MTWDGFVPKVGNGRALPDQNAHSRYVEQKNKYAQIIGPLVQPRVGEDSNVKRKNTTRSEAEADGPGNLKGIKSLDPSVSIRTSSEPSGFLSGQQSYFQYADDFGGLELLNVPP